MATLIPHYPGAIDTGLGLPDGTVPITGQWVNYASALVQTLQAEIGQDIVHGSHTLEQVLDTIIVDRNYPSLLTLSKFVGLKHQIVTATRDQWLAGFFISFTSTGSHQSTQGTPVCFGHSEDASVSEPYLYPPKAHPASAIGLHTDQYTVRSGRANQGSFGGSSTHTARFLQIYLPFYPY